MELSDRILVYTVLRPRFCPHGIKQGLLKEKYAELRQKHTVGAPSLSQMITRHYDAVIHGQFGKLLAKSLREVEDELEMDSKGMVFLKEDLYSSRFDTTIQFISTSPMQEFLASALTKASHELILELDNESNETLLDKIVHGFSFRDSFHPDYGTNIFKDLMRDFLIGIYFVSIEHVDFRS